MDHPPFSFPTAPHASLPQSASPGQYPDLAHPDYGGYNNEWDAEQQQTLVNYLIQMMGGGSSTAGVPQATNNDGHQYCKWLMPNGMPCNKGFANFNGLVEHTGREHDVQGSASRRVVCRWLSHQGLCGQEYRRDAFRRHIGIHIGLFVRCAECGKCFSRNDSLRAHLKKEHGKE